MRCSIKVAYRDGLTRVERREPSVSSDDDRALQTIFMDIMESWDRFSAKRTSDSAEGASRRALRSVDRAFRFSSWAFVRLSVSGHRSRTTGIFKFRFDITVSDPNRAGDDVMAATRREAEFLAEIIVARREIADPAIRAMITFDETNEFFAAALASGVVEAARDARSEKRETRI